MEALVAPRAWRAAVKVWKLTSENIPREVECEVFKYPHTDADGDTIFENTHWLTEAEAWDYALTDANARISLAARSVRDARQRLAQEEKEAADAALMLAAVLAGREEFARQVLGGPDA
jgi:hypothetical protein